jgi:hypothetical protein
MSITTINHPAVGASCYVLYAFPGQIPTFSECFATAKEANTRARRLVLDGATFATVVKPQITYKAAA